MDAAGWIDISMIASFNRIKALTPDTPLVKEVMLLSSALQIREEKVRLANGAWRPWRMPDAKSAAFPEDDEISESISALAAPGIGLGLDAGATSGVEGALMKHSGGVEGVMNGGESR